MKITDIFLQTLQDKKLCLAFENIIRGGIGSVVGNRFVKSDENRRKICIDEKNLYGWAMSESLLYKEIEKDRNSHGKGDLPRNFCTKVE